MVDGIRSSYPPGGPLPADQLLQGAIDLHHHGYPEFTFRCQARLEDATEFELCRHAGMAGIVLKSHMWPTVGRAYLLRTIVPGIEIIPSITLNTVVGGFNPAAVESRRSKARACSSCRPGARPTLSSAEGSASISAGILERSRL